MFPCADCAVVRRVPFAFGGSVPGRSLTAGVEKLHEDALITGPEFALAEPSLRRHKTHRKAVLCHVPRVFDRRRRSPARFRQENAERRSSAAAIRAAQHPNPALMLLDNALGHP